MDKAVSNLVAFETALDQRDIKYVELENAKQPSLRIRYDMDKMFDLDVYFWFDEDGESVHYGTGRVAHVPEFALGGIFRVINDANVKYRWLTFYLDADNDIVCSGDQILSKGTVGEVCYESLGRVLNICEEAYNEFMKQMFSSF